MGRAGTEIAFSVTELVYFDLFRHKGLLCLAVPIFRWQRWQKEPLVVQIIIVLNYTPMVTQEGTEIM